jgi:hypothetical protein
MKGHFSNAMMICEWGPYAMAFFLKNSLKLVQSFPRWRRRRHSLSVLLHRNTNTRMKIIILFIGIWSLRSEWNEILNLIQFKSKRSQEEDYPHNHRIWRMEDILMPMLHKVGAYKVFTHKSSSHWRNDLSSIPKWKLISPSDAIISCISSIVTMFVFESNKKT